MKRILVVDDDGAIRELLAEIVRSMGHEVISAQDGCQGLYIFVNSSIDLVVTDFDMPHMNGSSLAHNIKIRSPGTPVVLVTGSDIADNSAQAFETIFNSVIKKPFDFEDIEGAIHNLVGLDIFCSNGRAEGLPGICSEALGPVQSRLFP